MRAEIQWNPEWTNNDEDKRTIFWDWHLDTSCEHAWDSVRVVSKSTVLYRRPFLSLFCSLSLSKLYPPILERCGPEHFDAASRWCYSSRCNILHRAREGGDSPCCRCCCAIKSQEVNRQFTTFTISPCFLFLPTWGQRQLSPIARNTAASSIS